MNEFAISHGKMDSEFRGGFTPAIPVTLRRRSVDSAQKIEIFQGISSFESGERHVQGLNAQDAKGLVWILSSPVSGKI